MRSLRAPKVTWKILVWIRVPHRKWDEAVDGVNELRQEFDGNDNRTKDTGPKRKQGLK
jgi:hypothetical protein